MFEKSKSEITFKEFQNTLNVINNFENEWGHFCDPENNNNINNIIETEFYQYIKEPTNVKVEKVKVVKEIEPNKVKVEKVKIKVVKEIEPNKVKVKVEKEVKVEKVKVKESSIIKNIFNYTIIISISFYVIYKLSGIGIGGGGL